jgi:hypothetical protein
MIALFKAVSVIISNRTHETLEPPDAEICNAEVELIRSTELCHRWKNDSYRWWVWKWAQRLAFLRAIMQGTPRSWPRLRVTCTSSTVVYHAVRYTLLHSLWTGVYKTISKRMQLSFFYISKSHFQLKRKAVDWGLSSTERRREYRDIGGKK